MDGIGSEQRGLEALPELLRAHHSRRVLVITGPSARHLERIRGLLQGFELRTFEGARRHVPEEIVAEARRLVEAEKPDALIALGGGSAIGLGKALMLSQSLPFIAVPTTYSGSEQTTLYGTTRDGKKTTGRDPRVRPIAVIYDVALTLDMPKALSTTSLMNAFAHPLGTLAAGSTGDAEERALSAAELVYAALEALVRDPADPNARARAQRGAALAAAAIENGKFGLHHALAHQLGGAFDLEHGALHSVLLPHSVQRLRAENPPALAELERRLGLGDLEAKLFELLARAGAATSLRALGVSYAAFRAFVDAKPELPRELLYAAFHGRRPSRAARREDWGLREPVALCGAPLERARRVVIALHGRGASAESVAGRVLEITGSDPGIAVVALQAPDCAWYQPRYTAPRAELGVALETALEEVATVFARAAEARGEDRIALFGFSQGACVALEFLLRRAPRLAAVVALSGVVIGPAAETPAPPATLAGLRVLLGASEGDPYISAGDVRRTAEVLTAQGAALTLEMAPGETHTLHASQRVIARELLTGEPTPAAPTGFGNVHESVALPGALPRDRNTPRNAPYGLYPELTSGTAFTAQRSDNFRTWTYRIRPAAQQGALAPLPHPTFCADFEHEPAEVNLVGFGPLPLPSEPCDFLDGLATIGGAGSARLRRGYAVHLYAANRNMEDRAFYDADGELLLVPELGELRIHTELGVLDVRPGEIALLPRGLRFSVALRGPAARGYVAEVFGRHFRLPERGPIGSNGLAEARHFRTPSAWHEDRLAPGYRIAAKFGGALYEARQDYSPFDVAAWHGNHCPYVYDLALFTPVGYTRIDHPDPSVHTVLSAPLDEQGVHSLDLVVFPPRWDATEGTFRPPYFHRNATTEINGIVREVSTPGSMFEPGCLFLTPSMTPHGPVARATEHAFALSPEAADRPHRYSESACWFQLETALPFSFTAWAREAPHRLRDWQTKWGVYRSHFDPQAAPG
jgi:homogentisate 1,2-dioxygenase